MEDELISVLSNRHENIFFKQSLLRKFNNQSNYTDALRKVLKPEYIVSCSHEEYTQNKFDAFVLNFKLGNYMACMAYLNCGADDFNAVDEGYCPSLCIAVVFDCYHDNLYSQSNVKGHINTLNDFLYMYRKLKESPQGLNMSILNKHPHIQNTLKKMDDLLLKPEEKRFSLTPPKSTKQKNEPIKRAKKSNLFKKIIQTINIFVRA